MYNNFKRGEFALNILFCGDNGVCQGIYLSALSIIKNTEKEICIYILTASVSKRKAIDRNFADELQTVISEKNSNSKVVLIDISRLFADYLPLCNMNTRFTPLCMLRLFADMVPEIPDKILYLDTDVLCRADFSEL